MIYITEAFKQKTYERGHNVLSYFLFSYENSTTCIVLFTGMEFGKIEKFSKIYSDLSDLDTFNLVLKTMERGTLLQWEQTRSFFYVERIYKDMYKRFPNHFK